MRIGKHCYKLVNQNKNHMIRLLSSTGWAKKVAQSSNHHINATVPDKIKRISPQCSGFSKNKDDVAVFI